MRSLIGSVTGLAAAILALTLAPACSTSDGGAASDADAAAPSTDGDGQGDDTTDPGADAGTGASCSATSCKTGCCSGDACKKPSAAACGKAGSACVDCRAAKEGHICNGGECGCSSSYDCDAGEICDSVTHKCGKSCANEPCKTGCCSSSGVCLAGKDPKACGASSSCVDCSKSPDGAACTDSGACGCNSAADCGTFRACDLTTHKCTSTCSPTQPCNGGCCAGGTCQGGQTKTQCGDSGGACTDCSGNPTGTNVCAYTAKGGKCGCLTSADCPTAQACDPTTRTCGTACSPTNADPRYCNRGCCDPTTSKCAVGTSPSACGDAPAGFVAICKTCSAATDGPLCLAGSKCGCSGPSDCPGRTCSGGRCCSAKDAPCAAGSDCCSGVCIGINGVHTCG